MRVHVRWLSRIAFACSTLLLPRVAASQTTFQACTPGALGTCALLRFTSTVGGGPGGLNLFQIAIDNQGSLTSPLLPTTIYYLALFTGQTPGVEIDPTSVPVTAGAGASLSDNTAWSVGESGDLLVLSAPSNGGVGGCATAAPRDGVGQTARTCDVTPGSAFITFDFFTPRAFDPTRFTLADLEVTSLIDGTTESCGVAVCTFKQLASTTVATPEPGSAVLAFTGLIGLAGIGVRRRTRDLDTTHSTGA